MVGMIQILTYLLCVYLVFKGIEIFQIAWMSTSSSRGAGMGLGALMVLLSIVAGVMFVGWADSQARSMSSGPDLGSIDEPSETSEAVPARNLYTERMPSGATPTGIPGISVGMTMDDVRSRLGPATSTQPDGQGSTVWTYAARDATVRFASGRVVSARQTRF